MALSQKIKTTVDLRFSGQVLRTAALEAAAVFYAGAATSSEELLRTAEKFERWLQHGDVDVSDEQGTG